VRDDLRICLRAEAWPLARSASFSAVVLDDAVVDDDDVAATVLVGMGIDVAGTAVGGPARVTDAHRALGQAVLQAGGESAELAHALADDEPAINAEDSEAGAVIAAILQALEPLEEEGRRRPIPRVAYDSTHKAQL
jgi:hypothetical protein